MPGGSSRLSERAGSGTGAVRQDAGVSAGEDVGEAVDRPTDDLGDPDARVRLRGGLLLTLAGLSAFGPLSLDLYLPAFPSIAATLGVSTADMQLTFLTGVGSQTFDFGASQFQIRALSTVDLARTQYELPIRIHANLGAIVDGSGSLLTPCTKRMRSLVPCTEPRIVCPQRPRPTMAALIIARFPVRSRASRVVRRSKAKHAANSKLGACQHSYASTFQNRVRQLHHRSCPVRDAARSDASQTRDPCVFGICQDWSGREIVGSLVFEDREPALDPRPSLNTQT